MQGILLGIHIRDIFLDAALVIINLLVGAAIGFERIDPLVLELNPDSAIEVGQFPQPRREGVVVKNNARAEDFDIGLETYLGSCAFRIGGRLRSQGANGGAPFKTLAVLLPLAMDGHIHPFTQGVDHGNPDAMEPTGHLVPPGPELAAGVEHGKHGLQSAATGAGMDVGGNATAVVGDAGGAIGMEHHFNGGAVARQGLINRIVHHLVNKVMQTARAGGADIHTRPLPDRFQAFKHLNLFGAVGGIDLGGVAHSGNPADSRFRARKASAQGSL